MAAVAVVIRYVLKAKIRCDLRTDRAALVGAEVARIEGRVL
jgi:hypothetical protein